MNADAIYETETMAELCARQGRVGEAIDIYRRLADSIAEPALRAVIGAIRLREQIEDARQHLDRDAHARVADRNHRVTALATPRQRDSSAVLSVLRGIVQQIRDDLGQPHRIGHQSHGLFGQVDDELVASGLDERPARLDGAAQRRTQIHGLSAQLDAAARHARDLHEIVDEPH